MAGKLIPLEEAASMLGLTAEQLSDLRQKNEIFGTRVGSSWKFKMEEIERVAGDLGVEVVTGDGGLEDSADLSSDHELIASDDDIALAEDDDGEIDLAADPLVGGSSVLSGDSKKEKGSGTASHILSGEEADAGQSPSDTGKMVDNDDLLLAEDELFAEDELMLEEDSDEISLGPDSDMGSDFDDSSDAVIGDDSSAEIQLDSADSGINLSPTDSGLSLDEAPLDMAGSDIDQLELPEDDEVIALEDPDLDDSSEDAGDFMLTPIAGDEMDEDSSEGSQVIALEDSEIYDSSGSSSAIVDSDMEFEDAEPLVADGDSFEADFEEAGFDDAAAMAPADAQVAMAPVAPEAPYSFWNILSLGLVLTFLMFGGLIAFDVSRHIWNYDKPSGTVSTFVMDPMIDMIGWDSK